MSNYGEQQQYGKQTDEYGNPIQGGLGGHAGHKTTGQEYGGAGAYGADQYGAGAGAGTGAHGTHGGIGTGMTHDTGVFGAGRHRRSGSSSSSSSEDDGQGGRRKKGLKDKIKEKLPGGHKDDQQQYSTGTTGYGGGEYGAGAGEHEKKGIMDKIKDKLPGGHN